MFINVWCNKVVGEVGINLNPGNYSGSFRDGCIFWSFQFIEVREKDP
jgi:hypothetical protein